MIFYNFKKVKFYSLYRNDGRENKKRMSLITRLTRFLKLFSAAIFVKRWVAGIKVFGIKPFFGTLQTLTETLIVYDFPLP